jgi:hypothetical protein
VAVDPVGVGSVAVGSVAAGSPVSGCGAAVMAAEPNPPVTSPDAVRGEHHPALGSPGRPVVGGRPRPATLITRPSRCDHAVSVPAGRGR